MTKFKRHCQSAPERKCDRDPPCGMDCYFDNAELPVQMPLAEPPDWVNEPPEFKWSLIAWAILLVVGAFWIVGLVL